MKTFKQFLKESSFKNYKYKNYLIAKDDDYGVVVYDKNGIKVLTSGLKNNKEAEKYIDSLKEDNNKAHIYFRKDLSDKEKNEIRKMIQGANVAFDDLLKNGYHPIYTDKNSLKDRWNQYAEKILFESFNDNDILKRIKILSKDSNYEDLEPVLYQSTRGGKDELVIYHNNKPIIPDDEYSIVSYTNGRERAYDSASKNELELRYNKFHSPKYLKDFQQNQKIYWKSPKLNKFKLDEDVKVLPSQNKAWGFYNELYTIYDGDMDKIKKTWNEMFEILLKLTSKDSKSVRDFLDSKAGRYLADEFYNDIKNGNLKKAFEKKYDVDKFNKAYKSFLKESYQTECKSYRFKATLNGKNINGSVSVWKNKKTNKYDIESDGIIYNDEGFNSEKDALDYFVEFLNDGDYEIKIDKKPYQTETISI